MWTTGDAATWYRQYRSDGSSGGGGGGGRGQRDHSFRLDLRSPRSPVDFEVFALSAGQADVVTTCFVPAIAPAPGTSRVGAPRIVVESRVRLLGRPSFAEAEVRLANAGDGDALRVRLDPPTLADGWELLSQRVAGEPLPDPLEVGRIGAGGTGILLLRLCRREGDALPAVTIHGRYTDEGGTALAF